MEEVLARLQELDVAVARNGGNIATEDTALGELMVRVTDAI